MEEEIEDVINCICGATEDDPEQEYDWVDCDECHVWFHQDCVRYVEGSFICKRCKGEEIAKLPPVAIPLPHISKIESVIPGDFVEVLVSGDPPVTSPAMILKKAKRGVSVAWCWTHDDRRHLQKADRKMLVVEDESKGSRMLLTNHISTVDVDAISAVISHRVETDPQKWEERADPDWYLCMGYCEVEAKPGPQVILLDKLWQYQIPDMPSVVRKWFDSVVKPQQRSIAPSTPPRLIPTGDSPPPARSSSSKKRKRESKEKDQPAKKRSKPAKKEVKKKESRKEVVVDDDDDDETPTEKARRLKVTSLAGKALARAGVSPSMVPAFAAAAAAGSLRVWHVRVPSRTARAGRCGVCGASEGPLRYVLSGGKRTRLPVGRSCRDSLALVARVARALRTLTDEELLADSNSVMAAVGRRLSAG